MNILAVKYQMVAWINNFIFTVAFIYSFEVYWNSREYQVNVRGWVSMRQGFTTKSDSSTLCFLLIVGHCQSVIFNLYQRQPWKRAMSDNWPLIIWVLINLCSVYVVYFHQEWLWFMGLKPISQKLGMRVLIVMAGAFGLSLATTTLIYRSKEDSEQKSVKK